MDIPRNAAPVATGETIAGKYRVERVIGEGGMGVVVAAKHLTLGTTVAIKFLLHASASQNHTARFLREARAAARIQSEHVARVIDVATLDDGSPYIVMELLQGKDLAATVLERGAMPFEEAVDYVLQACEAIAEAHALGIVHRDLKPSNLFLGRRPDGSALVKVLDFGLAKLMEVAAEDGAVTASSAALGSPLYMSPEQMWSAKSVDTRTDLWSLGVVLYELITAHRPFDVDTLPALLMAVGGQPFTPIAKWRPDVPPALAAAIARCLEKEPAQRMPTVRALAEALLPCGSRAAQISVDRVRGLTVAAADADTAVAATSPAIVGAPRAPSPATQSTSRAAWGASSAAARPRSRRNGVIAGVVGVAIGAAGVTLFVVASRDGGSPQSTAPATPAPSASVAAEPSASPASSPSPQASAPAASTSAPPVAASSARPSTSARAGATMSAMPVGKAFPTAPRPTPTRDGTEDRN